MEVLQDKYRLTYLDAYFLSRFLLKMLKWNPKERPSAQEMLEDPWLKMQPEYETYVGKTFYKEWKHATNPEYQSSSSSDDSAAQSGEDRESEQTGSEEGSEEEDYLDEEGQQEPKNRSV